jgi:hypothetical protein
MQSILPKLNVSGAGIGTKVTGGPDMSDIPLDLQRRFEQRWAARFVRPAPKKQELERQDQQLTLHGKGKRKTQPIKPVASSLH